jgi:CTP synthase (UTP-ammonia lyase)
MADFNKKYAEDVVGKDKVAAAGDPNAVLDLVLGTEYTFGSAAWFLATQCAPEFKTKLADGTKESWTNYITGCVKTTVDEKREKLWKASLDALSKPA